MRYCSIYKLGYWTIGVFRFWTETETQTGGHFFSTETDTRIIIYAHNSNNSAYIFHTCFKSVQFLQFCLHFSQTSITRLENQDCALANLSRPRLNKTMNFVSCQDQNSMRLLNIEVLKTEKIDEKFKYYVNLVERGLFIKLKK